MLIQDLNHLEVVTETSNIEGGFAIADASASSYASGRYFAGTATYTNTSVSSGSYYYYYGGWNSSSSNSGSSAAAY